DLAAVGRVVELLAREHRRWQVGAEELERMDSDREAGLAVVGEHPFPAGEVGQVGSLGGRVERERQLLRPPSGAGDGLRPEDETELPEQVSSPLAEAVARTSLDECFERV